MRGVLRKEEIQSQFEELKKKRAHGQHVGAIWNVKRERERFKNGRF